jgi:hypothetical protein
MRDNQKRLHIDMSPATFLELEAIARKQARSLASFVNHALMKIIKENGGHNQSKIEDAIEVTLQLRPNEVDALKALADKRGCSLRAMARRAIQNYLHYVAQKADGEGKASPTHNGRSNGSGHEDKQDISDAGLAWLTR